MDRKWMQADRLSEEYENGVKEFISFAIQHTDDKSLIRCPCWKCMNIHEVNDVELYEYLMMTGINKNYTVWTKHGETKDSSNNFQFGEGLENTTNMNFVDEDDNISNTSEENLRDHQDPEMNEGLNSDDDKPLWPGCTKFSKLSAVLTCFNFKAAFQLSDVGFTKLLSMVSDMLPDENVLPRRTYEAKQMLNSIGLTNERIHACRNDCILFRGEYANLEESPMCNTPRYKKDNSPAKVMWYFPIIPRFRRLYSSAENAKHLKWHSDSRIKDGMLRHPADSPQWKNIDLIHPQFGYEPRNLRLALSTDGMNPFGMQSTSHSTWPVILIIYNLPPWLCMKRKYMMMSILISGPSQPGNNIDVYLAPLIDDLKLLWEDGTIVYDGHKEEYFTLRAMIFGTINDFPAYGYLSGYSVKGKLACPICGDYTDHIRLKHCKKEVFMGSRKWLPLTHRYRKMKAAFNGRKEEGRAPPILTGSQLYEKVQNLETKFGKGFAKDVPTSGWKKMSIFFQLPYWEDLHVRHFVDVMHVQKNVFESLIGTLLGLKRKSKDGMNARRDLVDMGLRPELAPVEEQGDVPFLPPAAHTLSTREKTILCETLQSVKVPQRYSSNIRNLISVKEKKLKNLKSHDCHVIMGDLLPVAIRSILPVKVRTTVTKLCFFFKAICSKVIDPNKLSSMEKQAVETLCELEMYFPPSFFDIMVHLIIHLVHETRFCGNARMRWMYPVERFMKVLKGYVMNRSRPEGCIAGRYLVDEAVEYWIEYIPNVEAIGLPRTHHSRSSSYEGVTGGHLMEIEKEKLDRAHLCVLHNSTEFEEYVELHKQKVRSDNPRRSETWITREHNQTFIPWFHSHILEKLEENKDSVSDRVKWLSRGPCDKVFSYHSYIINGYTFCTKEHDLKRTTQNSGISLVAEALHMSSVKDRNPIWGDMTYFGVIEYIWELDYIIFRIPVFGCVWVDNNNGLQVDDMGFTRVDLNRVGYKDDPFILASYAQQVFYVSDPSDNRWSIVLLSNKINNSDLNDENVDDDEDYNVEDDPFVGIHARNEDEAGCFYIREDHMEGEWVTPESHTIPSPKKRRKLQHKP